MRLILCGFKNCGKTTLATAYANAVGCQMADTDHIMLKTSGFDGTIGALYKSLGEKAFRTLEAETVGNLQPEENAIIATGGGTMMVASSRQQLKNIGTIVYLNELQSTLLSRMLNSDKLPSFINARDPENSFKKYFEERHQIYKKCADTIITPSEQNIEGNIKTLEEIGNSYVQQ